MREHPVLRDVLLIDGSGPHVDLVPVQKEIIVDLHCGAAVLRGADIYVPGVMAAHSGECDIVGDNFEIARGKSSETCGKVW